MLSRKPYGYFKIRTNGKASKHTRSTAIMCAKLNTAQYKRRSEFQKLSPKASLIAFSFHSLYCESDLRDDANDDDDDDRYQSNQVCKWLACHYWVKNTTAIVKKEVAVFRFVKMCQDVLDPDR